MRRTLEKSGHFFKAKTQANTPEAIYDYYNDLISNLKAEGSGTMCFYSDIAVEVNAICKIIDSSPSVQIVMYQNVADRLNCEKLFNLQQEYNFKEY